MDATEERKLLFEKLWSQIKALPEQKMTLVIWAVLQELGLYPRALEIARQCLPNQIPEKLSPDDVQFMELNRVVREYGCVEKIYRELLCDLVKYPIKCSQLSRLQHFLKTP